MGRVIYSKRFALRPRFDADAALRKIASAIKTHRDLMAYLADVPDAEKVDFCQQVQKHIGFQIDWDVIGLGPDPSLRAGANLAAAIDEQARIATECDERDSIAHRRIILEP